VIIISRETHEYRTYDSRHTLLTEWNEININL